MPCSQIRCHADTHFAESIKNMKHEEFYCGIKCAHDLCYVSDACRHKITLKSVIYIMHYKMDIYIHPDDEDDGFISL